MPLAPAPPQAGQEQRVETAQRAVHHAAQLGEPAVVGEDLHHHLEVRNEIHGLEREPGGGDLTAWIAGLHLPPQPLGLACPGVQQARHPLVPPATCGRVHDAQRVLQDAARRGLTAPEPERSAVLDVVARPRDRLQMGAEHLEHQPGVAGDRELWEIGVGRKRLRACRRRGAASPLT